MTAFFAIAASDWQDVGDISSLMAIVLFSVAGILLGYALRGLVGRWQAEAIERKMRLRLEETEAEVKSRLKEADLTARAEVVKARDEFERSIKAKRLELEQAEERLNAKNEKLEERKNLLDERAASLDEKAQTLEDFRRKLRAEKDVVTEKERLAEERLAQIAKLTREEARREVMEEAKKSLEADVDSLSRRIQEAARDDAEDKARAIIADAIRHTAIDHIAEITTSVVHLPNEEMKGRIVGQGGRNVKALENATGVNFILDETPGEVILSSFDPLRREVAKKTLEALVADGRIHPSSIEATVAASREAVVRENREAGARAAAQAGVSGLSSELLKTMGALRFRTSYTQNVLQHSVEVALLAGAMAEELGIDAESTRRAGFLHDIGKSASIDKKGPHAELGAQFLKSRGESDAICRAVASHHGEGSEDGGAIGALVAAADAISSARPGARQETLSDYVERIKDVEKIATAHQEVSSAFAVQAGRDLRVMVDPKLCDDLAARNLARDIAREISARLRFPGQIRVSVIRETRTVEYAK